MPCYGEYEAIDHSFRKIDQYVLQHFDHSYHLTLKCILKVHLHNTKDVGQGIAWSTPAEFPI
jgi:hypothetical protein|nr:hypothetical protein [Mucilaginibacter sp. X4EP1]NYE66093.1 hypothetical protein [Mucilaginibacter sp. E4BP6]